MSPAAAATSQVLAGAEPDVLDGARLVGEGVLRQRGEDLDAAELLDGDHGIGAARRAIDLERECAAHGGMRRR